MGQYYKPTTVTTHEYVYSHDFGSGLKLMEHSWIKNDFVKFVESLLVKDGAWYGKPLCWAGDYADPEVDENGVVIKETYDGKEYDSNLYSLAKIKVSHKKDFKPKHYRYIVNETKKQFVDKNKAPKIDGWKIHPLPLLTCEGNGRGGGDYRGQNLEYVGIWARDIITVSTKKPKDYTEIQPNFIEVW